MLLASLLVAVLAICIGLVFLTKAVVSATSALAEIKAETEVETEALASVQAEVQAEVQAQSKAKAWAVRTAEAVAAGRARDKAKAEYCASVWVRDFLQVELDAQTSCWLELEFGCLDQILVEAKVELLGALAKSLD